MPKKTEKAVCFICKHNEWDEFCEKFVCTCPTKPQFAQNIHTRPEYIMQEINCLEFA